MMTATPNASSAGPLNSRVPQVSIDNRKLAKRIHDENLELAARLHKARFIYALYGALDGVSLSYSMVRLMFDMHFPDANTSSDNMHNWMMTPAGLATVAFESVSIIAWSMMANWLEADKKSNTELQKSVALYWAYSRLSMKALKNAYKGVRGLMQVLNTLGFADMRQLVVPVGVLLGGLSVLNRICYRREVDKRKVMMDNNSKFLEELQNFNKNGRDSTLPFSASKINEFRAAIAEQRAHYGTKRRLALLGSMAYGGIVDALYLYMGVLGLSVLAPQLYALMFAFTVIFSIACVAVRVYEEYDFQRKLSIAQLKVELAICGLELETLLFTEIESVIAHVNQNNGESPLRKVSEHHEKSALDSKIEEFEALRHKLQSLAQSSPFDAAMAGLRDGLSAYSMIASVLFATATACAMMAVTLPAFLTVASVILGMVSLIGLVAFAVAMNRPSAPPQPLRGRNAAEFGLTQQLETASLKEKLPILLQILKEDQRAVANIDPIVIKEAIWGRMNVDSLPQFYFQEWFEVARSFFSGMAKGQKTVDYTLNPLQAEGQDGHFHETPLMTGLAICSAGVFSVGLALRADAKGFGKIPVAKKAEAVVLPLTPQAPSCALQQDTAAANDDLSLAYNEPPALTPPASPARNNERVALQCGEDKIHRALTPAPQETTALAVAHDDAPVISKANTNQVSALHSFGLFRRNSSAPNLHNSEEESSATQYVRA